MRNIKLKYKGFIGDCQYSKYLGTYNGSILNANDLITYDGTTKEELIGEFKNSVNSYIDICASAGPYKLTDPKLFNTSRFFILLSITENILTLKYFKNTIKLPRRIFTHNKTTCEVNYSEKEKKFKGIIRHKGKKYKIHGKTLKELNDAFINFVSNNNLIKKIRK